MTTHIHTDDVILLQLLMTLGLPKVTWEGTAKPPQPLPARTPTLNAVPTVSVNAKLVTVIMGRARLSEFFYFPQFLT